MVPVSAHRAGRRSLRRRREWVHEISVGMTEISWQQDLEGHPKTGASWEGFILDQIVQHLGARPEQCHFWRTHTGAELDLLVVRGRHRLGFEIKRTTAPAITRSMRSALQDLKLSALTLVHAGDETFPLAKNIVALSWKDIVAGLRPLK